MTQSFFELLQIAVGNRDKLTRSLSADEWVSLYNMAKTQALVGIGFAGVSKLTQEQIPPTDLLSRWFFEASRIQEKNARLSAECADVCKQLEHDGFDCVVLKGQGNLDAYGGGLAPYRTPGDIDVWIRPKGEMEFAVSSGRTDAHYETYNGREAVVEYARMQARATGLSEKLLIRYHHVDMPWSCNADVEAHFVPMYLNNPRLNRRLQRFFEKQGEPVINSQGFPVPSASFNAIYQLTHIYKHLFEEGIGLRQLLDYYFVLKKLAECPGQDVETMRVLKSLHLDKLAAAVMYVLQTVFAMPDEYLICEPDEKEGRWLLNEIMEAGNFGKYDKRKGDLTNESSFHKFIRKTKHSLSLVKHYPHEALWEPGFRLYHFFWRKLRLWRFQ